MANSVFHFQQFFIKQDKCAMKVGTDGILLGAWCRPFDQGRPHILDVGTGTGLIALMLAQRFKLASIDAIEIDPVAAGQALENVTNSSFKDQIVVQASALQHFSPSHSYALIVSNPPFFTSGQLSPNQTRAQARHTLAFSLDKLYRFAQQHLADRGNLSIIWPADEADKVISLARDYGLFPCRMCWVSALPDKLPHRVLLSFGWQADTAEEQELVIQYPGKNTYTEAYRELTASFYTLFA